MVLIDNIYSISTIILVFLTSIIIFFKYRFTHWKRHGIAQVEPKIPFGNCGEFILNKENMGIVFQDIYTHFKKLKLDFGGYYNVITPEILAVNPDLVGKILVQDFQYFQDRAAFSDEKHEHLTGNLFSLKGTKWRNLRAKLTPTFTSGKMKMMFHTLVATTDELNHIFDTSAMTGEPVDVKDVFARFTTDVIGSCAFGLECNSLKDPDTEFRKYGQKILRAHSLGFILRYVGEHYPKLLTTLKIPVMSQSTKDFYAKIVEDMVNHRRERKIFRKDFLQLLIDLKQKGKLTDDDGSDSDNSLTDKSDGKSLTMQEITAQCFVFFIAGFDTSSTTMSYALFELTQNLDIQEKLREEIITTLKKHGGLTYDAIMEMEYMHKVVNETLRKYPVGAGLLRKCTQNYKLPGTEYIMKVGDYIRIPIFSIHRDPEYYPNPEKFDPERFTTEEKNKRPNFTFIPFGEGPRICIGLRFALLEVKVGLAVLLQKYKFTANSKTKVPLVFDPTSLVLSVKGEILVHATKIQD